MAARLSLIRAVVFTIIFTLVYGYDGCKIRYGRRGCLDKIHTGYIVTCDGRYKQTTVPKNIHGETVYLSLSNFKLDKISKEDFRGFPLVECIHIEDSQIRSIEADAFSELESLHELTMVGTQLRGHHLQFLNNHKFKPKFVSVTHSPTIQSLNFNGTRHLKHLRLLDLSDNGITHINPPLLADLYSLESLSLSRNALSTLPWDVFSDFLKLNELFLCGNQFQTIPQSMKQIFASVRKLTIKDNPLHCNCNLRWLKDFLDDLVDKEVDYDKVKCSSPKDESVEMKGLAANSFMCALPKTPVISYKMITGNEYAADCMSEGDPSPQLHITLPGAKVIIAPPAKDISKLETTSPFIITDPGYVTCVASNSIGTVTSKKDLPKLGASTGTTVVQQSSIILVVAASLQVFYRIILF